MHIPADGSRQRPAGGRPGPSARRSPALRLGTTVAVGAVVLGGIAAGGAATTRARHATRTAKLVPFGPSPAAGLTHRIGATPDTTVHVDVVLKNDVDGEASASGKAAVVAWLDAHHIRTEKQVDSVGFTARTAAVAKLFHVTFSDYRVKGATVYASTRPEVPSNLAPDLVAILGLNDVPVFSPAIGVTAPVGVRSPTSAPAGGTTATAGAGLAPRTGTEPSACSAAQSAESTWDGGGQTTYTLDQVGAHYGVDSLLAAGDGGTGVTVALVELAASSASDIGAYDTCFGLDSSNYSVVSVDGGGGTTASDPGGTLEADLDVEQVQTQAPDAKVISYEGPNTLGGSGSGFYDVLSQIVTADIAQVVSISWGGCEAYTGPTTEAALDGLLATAASHGQSVFVAAGDDGSEDCYGSPTGSSDALSVDFPAASPSVTAVGGTSFAAALPTSSPDVVWNDCAGSTDTCASSETAAGGGAGGGGMASDSAEPSWQQQDLPSENVTSPQREVPDLAAYAEGSLVYDDGLSSGYTVEGWADVSGTSAAAPLVAGLVADALSSTSCSAFLDDGGFGNVDPNLYAYYAAAPGNGYGTAFTDVTSGDNDFTDLTSHADYVAGTGYDLASGIGTPVAAGLTCPTVTSVSASSGAPGSSVTIDGTNLENAAVTFGSAPATITAQSATSITATVPDGAGTAGIDVVGALADATGSPFASTYPAATFTSPDTTTSTTMAPTTTSPPANTGSIPEVSSPSPPPASTPTTTSPPRPVITLAGSAAVVGSRASLVVTCTGARCSGRISLRGSETVTRKRGKSTVRVVEAASFGTTSYAVTADRRDSVTLTLTAAARSALAHARTHRVRATETVTVGGGRTVTHTVTLELAPVVTLRSTTARVSGSTVRLTLACAQVACAGRVTLSVRKVTLGSAGYRIAAGRSARVRVTFTPEGRRALAKAKGHLAAAQTATVGGGASVRRTTVLVV